MNISPYVMPGIKQSLMPVKKRMSPQDHKIDTIKKIVCSYFEVDEDKFCQTVYDRELIRIQRIIWFLVKQQQPYLGLIAIGRSVRKYNYSHGSVSVGIKTIKNDLDLEAINKQYFLKNE